MAQGQVAMSNAIRALLMAGGVALIAAGIVLAFFAHGRIVELAGSARVVSGLALRGAEAAVLYGGSWLAVKGWNGRWEKRA
ncbi:hypothetical protein AB0K89_15325 [Streptomyces cinnamoneus]|uniref:hypothetical protein n=1 Tax=Streptomyces cinnamoneus TaxID=53446 RepID=UPI0034120AD5